MPDTSSGTPRVIKRHEQRVSPWVRVVGKTVDFGNGGAAEVYHCIAQADYVAILARSASGLIPVVRQFRPAVEALTWELPAGLLERGESHHDACRRELLEEVGLIPGGVTYLGETFPDTGRLENRMHVYSAIGCQVDPQFVPEAGIEVRFVDPPALRRMIQTGEFRHQLHLGVLAAAVVLAPEEWSDFLVLGETHRGTPHVPIFERGQE